MCIFKISTNFCCNYILVKVNMSLPMSNSNYPAVQISLVCCKERKVKERENVRLSAAPVFPLKDFPLKRTESLMRGLFPHYLLLDSKKFLLTSNSNSFILTALFDCLFLYKKQFCSSLTLPNKIKINLKKIFNKLLLLSKVKKTRWPYKKLFPCSVNFVNCCICVIKQ